MCKIIHAHLHLGSLFDGIGGWLLAAENAGIKPLWRCEIDEYPRTVSEYHFPDVDSYGDIREVHGNEIAPVDIICAGSPCQNLSQAGNRKGLQGSESSLFYESIRILREMRDATNGKYPRFFVWENVTGAFSSNHGEDFRAVLEEIGQAKIPMPANGKWANAGMAEFQGCQVAWRVLDAQYWGVPQRRRRIFLVADFGGQCAGEILFKPEGLSGNIEEGGSEGQRVAGKTAEGIDDITLFEPRSQDGVPRIHGGICPTLNTAQGGQRQPCIIQRKTVRRLTPTECERLQGLPDGYTDIEFKGKPASDARRYKAIGNGMAQPCADFVISRIEEVEGK